MEGKPQLFYQLIGGSNQNLWTIIINDFNTIWAGYKFQLNNKLIPYKCSNRMKCEWVAIDKTESNFKPSPPTTTVCRHHWDKPD